MSSPNKSVLSNIPEQCISVMQNSCPYGRRKFEGQYRLFCRALLMSGDLGPDVNSLPDVGKVTYHVWSLSVDVSGVNSLSILL